MNNKRQFVLLIPLLAILLNLSIHTYLASHTRFISDDYCSAAMAKRLGIARATWYWYLNWSGRYSASTLDSTFGLMGPLTTPLAIPIFLLTWLGILTTTIYLLISFNKRRFLQALLLGANILFLTVLLSPDIRQSLYWGQGMRSVVPPMILLTLYFGWFRWFQTQNQDTKNLNLWLLASFFYAFGMGGFSETFTALQIVLFSTALLFELMTQNSFNRKTPGSYILSAALAGTILALIVMVVAPGNVYRQAQWPPAPGIGEILLISIRSFAVFWQSLVNSWDKLLGLTGGLGIGLVVGSQSESRRISKNVWALIPLLILGFTFTCFPPAAYGTSEAPPGRTLIIPVYILAIAITAFGYLAGNQLRQYSTGLRFTKALSLIAITAFMISNYLVDANLLASRRIFIEFADKWDRMHAQILEDKAAGKEQAIVATMDDVNWAGAVTFRARPKFWLNRCVSRYYGIETIAVDAPSSIQK